MGLKLLKNNKKNNDCGIVAAFNCAAWLNLSFTYKQIEKLALSCGYSEDRGIFPFQFDLLLKKLKIKSKKIKPRNIDDIEKRLYAGKLIILFYQFSDTQNGHIVSIFMDHEGLFRIINHNKDKKSWRLLKSNLRNTPMKGFHVYEIAARHIAK